MNVNDIMITSLDTITAFHVTTGDYLFTLDELQSASISNNQEKTDFTGKQGRKIGSLKRNKTATVSGNNGIVSGGLLGLQTGSDFENKDTEVMWTDYLTVKSNAATTKYKAVGTTGSEIVGIYVQKKDGTLGDMLKQGSAAATGVFTYAPATKALGFKDIADDTEIIVYYKRKIKASVLANQSDTYSGKAQLYVDATGEDKCGNIYHIQFYIPKADFNGEFTFEMGDNQTVQAFEAESLSGACGAGGALWYFTVFGVDAADVT